MRPSAASLPSLAEIRAEQERRRAEREAQRLTTERAAILANCSTLYGFIEEFWYILEPTRPFIGGWVIRAICSHLEAVTRGDIQYLLITVPPGMMKSLLVAVFWPAWEWGPAGLSSLRYLTSSYSEANVLRDNQKMRRLVESEKFQALWGDRVTFARDQNAKGKFENTATGGREGRAFASMTGGRGDRVIIDDPHSVDTAESDIQRAATVQTFREAIPDRLNDMQRSAIVVIMQRLHETDVAGAILKLGMPYVHLNLPMEFEVDRRCVTPIFTDPRTAEGELLFPERFPQGVVEGLKRDKGSYAYSGQYQQRPAPRDGGMFKRRWFEIVPAVPAGAQRVRKWDLAATKEAPGADPDWTVGLLMARDVMGFIFIEDVIRFRGSSNEVEQAIKNTATLDAARYGVVRIGLNQDPGQAGKAQVSYLSRQLLGYTVETERETGSKEVRAAPLAAQAEAGNVKIVEADWNETFLGEVEVFPSGAHDDQVDAASGAFAMLAGASIATWAALAS